MLELLLVFLILSLIISLAIIYANNLTIKNFRICPDCKRVKHAIENWKIYPIHEVSCKGCGASMKVVTVPDYVRKTYLFYSRITWIPLYTLTLGLMLIFTDIFVSQSGMILVLVLIFGSLGVFVVLVVVVTIIAKKRVQEWALEADIY